jgi:hypothetical protein
LAAVEDGHAHWAGKLTAIGEPVPPRTRVGLRSRALTWLAQRSLVDVVLPYVERAEHADANRYSGHPDATRGMAVDERAHARVYLDSTTSHKKPTDRSISGDEGLYGARLQRALMPMSGLSRERGDNWCGGAQTCGSVV